MPSSSSYSMRCPHCDGGMKIRSSKEETRLVRRQFLQCTDITCGFTCVAQLEIIGQLSPSSRPHPKVALPFSTARPPPAVLPTPANDPGFAHYVPTEAEKPPGDQLEA